MSVNYESKIAISLREMDILSGMETLSKMFCLHFEKGFAIKEKNLLPLEAHSVL